MSVGWLVEWKKLNMHVENKTSLRYAEMDALVTSVYSTYVVERAAIRHRKTHKLWKKWWENQIQEIQIFHLITRLLLSNSYSQFTGGSEDRAKERTRESRKEEKTHGFESVYT